MSDTIPEDKRREAAAAASRLLADPFLTEALDELVQLATEQAILGPDPDTRELNRIKVLAIHEIRASLKSVLDDWQQRDAVQRHARAHE